MGKSLNDLMGWPGKMTHRQFTAWQEWLKSEWNEPSRTDHYLMQLNTTLSQVNAKDPKTVKFHESKLKFRITKPVDPNSPEGLRVAKQLWIGRAKALARGKTVTYVEVPAPVELPPN